VNVLTEVLLKALVKGTDNDHKDITVTAYDTAELSTSIKTYLSTDVFQSEKHLNDQYRDDASVTLQKLFHEYLINFITVKAHKKCVTMTADKILTECSQNRNKKTKFNILKKLCTSDD